MEVSNTVRPKQRVLQSEKNTESWQNNNVNYWAARCNILPIANKDIIALYNAAAGKFDEDLYTYVTNPLGMDQPELKGYPSKIRNIDILSPNIQRLMGELSERFFNPMVVAINSNLKSKQYEEEYKLRFESLKRDFINGLVEEGLAPEEIQQTPLPPDLIKKQVSNLKDQEAIMGQDAIDYIMSFNEVLRVRRKTFYDAIVCNRQFTYRDLHKNDTCYLWISPLELTFLATPNTDFVEDMEAVKRTVRMTVTELIDFFQGVKGFTKEIIDEIEERVSVSGYNQINTGIGNGMFSYWFGDKNMNIADGLVVEHVQWTTMKKMFRVRGVDAFGNPYVLDMDEDYIATIDEEVEEYWINEKMEGYRIDNRHIIGVQSLPFQRGTYDNPSKCKNSYNGRVFGNNYVVPTSIVEKGIIYQTKYNIVHYFMEKILAKNKDKITIFPLGLIPEKEGYDEFTVMYYADAHGFFFVDETNPTAREALQHIRTLDMSLTSYIQQVYQILQNIKNDWDESIGFNRQRKGGVMASDGKAVTEDAIHMSSTSTEEFFIQHEEVIVRDLQALLDISKVAWSEGKKAVYMTSDYKRAELDIDPTVYCNIDHGVVVKNSGQEKRELDIMKGQIANLASQDKQISMLARIAAATNMPKLIEEMTELEDIMNKQQQAQADAENQLVEREIEQKTEDRKLKYYEIDQNNDTKRDIQLMTVQSSLIGKDLNNNGIDDATDLAKISLKREENWLKIGVERDKLNEQKEARKEATKVEREKMANDLKIAKSRPKPTKK